MVCMNIGKGLHVSITQYAVHVGNDYAHLSHVDTSGHRPAVLSAYQGYRMTSDAAQTANSNGANNVVWTWEAYKNALWESTASPEAE